MHYENLVLNMILIVKKKKNMTEEVYNYLVSVPKSPLGKVITYVVLQSNLIIPVVQSLWPGMVGVLFTL